MKWCCSASVFAVLLASASAPAQETFDELYTEAEAVPTSDVEGRRRAFAAAYRAFERIPEKTPAYDKALPRGAWTAFHAGHRRAAVLFFALTEAGRGGERVVTAMFISLFRMDGGKRDAVVTANAWYAKHERGVHDWLATPGGFGRLAAFGGELLQAGDPLGLWLLETQEVAMRGRRGREFALANLALAHRQSGRPERAEQAYRAALDVAPRDATLFCDYGLFLKGVGRIGEAFAAFVAGLRVESAPGASPASTNLGVLFQRTGENRGRDPRSDLVGVLKKRPGAALARRLLLDGLAGDRDRKSR